jgi:hypothetical protein
MTAIIGQGVQRPIIPLKDKGNKIRLRLRRTSLERELDELPSDLKSLVELLIQSRARVNSGIYETVAIWNKLRNYEKYWQQFQFNSEAQFLAHFCLPDGSLLASWTVMIQLFDRATFVLLGDEVLLYMMRWVSQYQTGADERRKDYEIIFDRYCKRYDSFNKLAFYDVVRRYFAERYEKQLAKEAGVSHEKWLKQRAKKAHRNKNKTDSQKDIILVGDKCASCSTKETIINHLLKYAYELEHIIKERLNEEVLPKKDECLSSLQSIHDIP